MNTDTFTCTRGATKMGTNPMNQEEREKQKSKRLANIRSAPRCLAQTRRGTLCQCPAIRSKRRCRLHGGAERSGAPRSRANGAYVHGHWTNESIAIRQEAA